MGSILKALIAEAEDCVMLGPRKCRQEWENHHYNIAQRSSGIILSETGEFLSLGCDDCRIE